MASFTNAVLVGNNSLLWSVLSFEDSKVSLQKWFLAIYFATSLKKGISSIQLSKHIGITQKSAWFMLHRIRHAAESDSYNKPQPGSGVEIDEDFDNVISKIVKANASREP